MGEPLPSMLAGLTPDGPAIPDADKVEASLDRLASTLVRRYCIRHECSTAGTGKPPAPAGAGPCLHRNHRRDMASLRELLEILDLSGEVAVAADYEAPSRYHTFSRDEAAQWAGKAATL